VNERYCCVERKILLCSVYCVVPIGCIFWFDDTVFFCLRIPKPTTYVVCTNVRQPYCAVKLAVKIEYSSVVCVNLPFSARSAKLYLVYSI